MQFEAKWKTKLRYTRRHAYWSLQKNKKLGPWQSEWTGPLSPGLSLREGGGGAERVKKLFCHFLMVAICYVISCLTNLEWSLWTAITSQNTTENSILHERIIHPHKTRINFGTTSFFYWNTSVIGRFSITVVWRSGPSEGHTMQHCTAPLDLTSGLGFANDIRISNGPTSPCETNLKVKVVLVSHQQYVTLCISVLQSTVLLNTVISLIMSIKN